MLYGVSPFQEAGKSFFNKELNPQMKKRGQARAQKKTTDTVWPTSS